MGECQPKKNHPSSQSPKPNLGKQVGGGLNRSRSCWLKFCQKKQWNNGTLGPFAPHKIHHPQSQCSPNIQKLPPPPPGHKDWFQNKEGALRGGVPLLTETGLFQIFFLKFCLGRRGIPFPLGDPGEGPQKKNTDRNPKKKSRHIAPYMFRQDLRPRTQDVGSVENLQPNSTGNGGSPPVFFIPLIIL